MACLCWQLLHRNKHFSPFCPGAGWGAGSKASLRSPQLKLVGHAAITNEPGHFHDIRGHRRCQPSLAALAPSSPPRRPSPKGSLVAIRVMKHPATGGHALGTRSAATAAARTHPHPVRPASGRHRHGGPPARNPPQRGGLPGPVLPVTSPQPRTDPRGPSPAAPELRVTFPISPSRLPACTPEGWSAEQSGAARRERRERPSSLSPSSSATAAALTPETELAGAARRSASPGAFSCVAPGRQASKQAGGVGAPGRERARGAG